MQSLSRNVIQRVVKIGFTSIVLSASIAIFGHLALSQRGAPTVPDPPKPKPDEIKDPVGGPREDIWKDANGLTMRLDSYTPAGQRATITIYRRCPDGSVDQVETFEFGIIAGG